MYCPVCLQEHFIRIETVRQTNVFRGVEVVYDAEMCFCDISGSVFCTEEQTRCNDIRMKDAYREAAGLLSRAELGGLCRAYGISPLGLSKAAGEDGMYVNRILEGHLCQSPEADLKIREELKKLKMLRRGEPGDSTDE